MKVAFRVDASREIGSGHVMRCLALAEALRGKGGTTRFVCRENDGDMTALLERRGFAVSRLASCGSEAGNDWNLHAAWLGTSREADASESVSALQPEAPWDWLVVDHYALDRVWEVTLRSVARKILVIDDLADRGHDCDGLLDTGLGKGSNVYQGLVPPACELLLGPRYALLRPEFARLRSDSLERRRSACGIRQLLINMGGVDKDNLTGRVLDALKGFVALPPDCRIVIVMGETAPWTDTVKVQAGMLPWRAEVLVNVPDMAELMAGSDLAIGAAGGTAWERCCLGLPTVLLVLAENQRAAASALERAGAAILMDRDWSAENLQAVLRRLFAAPREILEMSKCAAEITAGDGLGLLLQHLTRGSG